MPFENAKPSVPSVKRVEPMTPEQAAEWDARKLEQWQRIAAAEFEASLQANLSVSMVQTGHTFAITVEGPDYFRDELVFGDPAKSVPRDDRLFNLRAVDLSDRQIRALFAEWRQGRKLPPPSSRIE